MRRKAANEEALCEITGATRERVDEVIAELRALPTDREIERSSNPDICRHHFRVLQDHYQIYIGALIALTSPAVVIETGVEWGKSTYRILSALNRTRGTLYSIDPTKERTELEALMPVVVGDRDDWVFMKQRSQEALPLLAERGVRPNIFLHDSDHSYEVQMMEYRWAWKNLVPGGFLASDDIYWGTHGAWETFCAEVERDYWACGNCGVIKK